MRRQTVSAFVIYCCLSQAVWSNSAQPSRDAEIDRLESDLHTAMEDVQRGTLHAAIPALEDILKSSAFGTMSPSDQHLVHLLYGGALIGIDDKKAQAELRISSGMPEVTAVDWTVRFEVDQRIADYQDAAECLSTIARNWSASLRDLPTNEITWTANKLLRLPNSHDASSELLESLFAARWRADGLRDDDILWMWLTKVRLDEGDVAGARIAAGEVHSSGLVTAMLMDKQYDPVTNSDAGHYDLVQAQDAEIVAARASVESDPSSLGKVRTLADKLNTADKSTEALAEIDQALARNPTFFSDYDIWINWALDSRARILFQLGRTDDGFAAMTDAANHKEDGRENFSQKLNLAEAYYLFDRTSSATPLLDSLQTADPPIYHRMSVVALGACVYSDLGDVARTRDAVEFARVHREENVVAFLGALMCAGDIDDAAKEVIDRLDNPVDRTFMLESLQDFPELPHLSARARGDRNAWIAVRSRPDVQNAIAKYGRIEKIPLNPSYFPAGR
jgi:tetratricopeptide (TPR) repeat protein